MLATLFVLSIFPVVGGNPADNCEYPSTANVGHRCSGVLVHPNVVLTAAHCFQDLTENVEIGFGSDGYNPLVKVTASYCRPYSGFAGFGTGTDWAYCWIENPVKQIPVTPVVTFEDLTQLEGTIEQLSVDIVGFGRDEDNKRGLKRVVTMPVKALRNGELIVGTRSGEGPCFGDSGGPAYVQMPDSTWRVLATDSYGTECGGYEGVTLTTEAAFWVEQDTGLNLTNGPVPVSLESRQIASQKCSSFDTVERPEVEGHAELNEEWFSDPSSPPVKTIPIKLDEGGCSTTAVSKGWQPGYLFLALLISCHGYRKNRKSVTN